METAEEIKITDSDYDRWDYETAEEIYDTTGNRLISLNGNLYYKESTYGLWEKIGADDFNVVGDGHINTNDQRKGIYDLLVVLLEPDTSATVTSVPKSDGNHSGSGRTKDFSTTNK